MLTIRKNPVTKRREYCLISQNGRALRYFGKRRPSDETVQAEEARIQYFADKGKTA